MNIQINRSVDLKLVNGMSVTYIRIDIVRNGKFLMSEPTKGFKENYPRLYNFLRNHSKWVIAGGLLCEVLRYLGILAI